jgi:hypothetical protein
LETHNFGVRAVEKIKENEVQKRKEEEKGSLLIK